MDAINGAKNKDRKQFRGIIQLFIDGKMNSYNKIKVSCDPKEESITIEKQSITQAYLCYTGC